MLERLQVKDVALISRLDLEFAPGLNLITGETGSGKSILLDALGFALGGRATVDLIRGQAESAQVSASFAPPTAWSQRWRAWFDEKGLPYDEDALLLKRELSRSGRSRAWVNGEACNVGVLAELGQALVDFHGQHDHQALLRPGEHLDFLDRFGGLDAERAKVSALHEQASACRRALEGPGLSPAERARQLDFLDFQLAELEALGPQIGELDGLRQAVRRMANAGRRGEWLSRALAALDGEEGGILALAAEAGTALQRLAELDPEQRPLSEQFDRAWVELKDLAATARDLAEGQDLDPAVLERAQRRLHDWEAAARKLRCSDDELPEAWERLKAQRQALLAVSDDEAALTKALAKAEADYSIAALGLSRAREKAAAAMITAMTRELQELLGPKALFTVRLERRLDPEGPYQVEGKACRGDRSGVDEAAFLIAPNVGEAPKPLARIASGGELSRVTLALKTVFSRQEGAPCLVFDEIDTGISGRVADKVGGKIAALAARHQVLCITHLPQIASLPARHIRVSKAAEGPQTMVSAICLDAAGRQEELAAMISGDPGTYASALAHAKELLQQGAGSGS